MKIKFFVAAGLFLALTGCGAKAAAEDCQAPDPQENVELINSVYNIFVFATETDETAKPEDFFTANALRKLQADYEYDCEEGPCYAFYALRTDEQDSKPGSDEESRVGTVERSDDGWYVVSYSDMGWSGMTRVKVVDGKIDDYARCVADL